VNDYGITCETNGDMATGVTPLAGFEAYGIIAARWIAKDAGDLLVRHAGLYLGVILGGHLAAGGEKADGNKKSHSPQCDGHGDHFLTLLHLSFHLVLLLFVKSGY
jgi:hypothetical protein